MIGIRTVVEKLIHLTVELCLYHDANNNEKTRQAIDHIFKAINLLEEDNDEYKDIPKMEGK